MAVGDVHTHRETIIAFTPTPEERANAWPVAWSAVWVGALSALAAGLIFGLIGLAVGAYTLGETYTSWRNADNYQIWALVFCVCGSFFAFVIGGWVAGKITAFRRCEYTMLHGAIAWLVTIPVMLAVAALGAAPFFGPWQAGFAGTPAWVEAKTVENAAEIARTGALGAVTALLLGLVGAVLGGWMASGEPMTFTAHRNRNLEASDRPARR